LDRQPRATGNDDDIAEFDSHKGLAPDEEFGNGLEPRFDSDAPLPDVDSPASKRARISVDSDLSDMDSTERPPKVSPTLRFRFRPSRPEEGSDSPGSTHPSRPAFVLPDSPEERHKFELPAIFSPHRKSQRFIPGGLADSMRTHIMEAFSEQHRGLNAPNRGARLRVTACRNTSQASLIQAVSEVGSEEHLLLVGNKNRPGVGDTVRARGASWEVEIDKRTWAVFLDWKTE
jgi:hypothetical protein